MEDRYKKTVISSYIGGRLTTNRMLNAVLVRHMSAGSSTVLFLNRPRRERVPKVENFYEVTIPKYTPEDFRGHFRLSRRSLDLFLTRMMKCDRLYGGGGPPPNAEKDLLMFLWYLGTILLYIYIISQISFSSVF